MRQVMSEDSVQGLIGGIVIFIIGIYFNDHWLGIGAIIFGALAIFGSLFSDDEESKDKLLLKHYSDSSNIIRCQNCSESLAEKSFFNANNTLGVELFMADTPRVKQDGIDIGLNIYPMLCFKCGYVSEYATDPWNVSGRAKNGYEYFDTFKLDKEFKKKFITYAKIIKNKRVQEKISNL